MCTENDFKYYKIVEENQIVDESELTSTGPVQSVLRNMITGVLKIEMFPYEESLSLSRAPTGSRRRMRTRSSGSGRPRSSRDIAAKQAAGECTLTAQDVIDAKKNS